VKLNTNNAHLRNSLHCISYSKNQLKLTLISGVGDNIPHYPPVFLHLLSFQSPISKYATSTASKGACNNLKLELRLQLRQRLEKE